MHQHGAVPAQHEIGHLAVARRIVPFGQYIAHRGDDRRLRPGLMGGAQERQQFGAELAPPERVHLGDDHLRPVLAVKLEEALAAEAAKSIVRLLAGGIDGHRKGRVGGAQRRQLLELGLAEIKPLERHATGDEEGVDVFIRQRPGEKDRTA